MDPLLERLSAAELRRVREFLQLDRDRLMLRVMITLGESYGSGIYEAFRKIFKEHVKLSRGMVSFNLNRMEAMRLICFSREDSHGRPGRARRYFIVTELGKAALRQYEEATAFLREPVGMSR